MPSKLDELGLQGYLDATKGLHRDNGYRDFATMQATNTPIIRIAVAFGVSRPTVYDWIKLYDKIAAKK